MYIFLIPKLDFINNLLKNQQNGLFGQSEQTVNIIE
jgi:hypothetical protein